MYERDTEVDLARLAKYVLFFVDTEKFRHFRGAYLKHFAQFAYSLRYLLSFVVFH